MTLLSFSLQTIWHFSLKELYSKIILVILIILLGFIIGNIAKRVLNRVLVSLNVNKLISKSLDKEIHIVEIISTLVSYAIYIVSVIYALSLFELTRMLLKWLILIVLLIILVSFLIEIKDFGPNLFAGIYLLFRKPIKRGDMINFQDVKGNVTKVGLLHTIIEEEDKNNLVVPNSFFMNLKLVVSDRAKSKKITYVVPKSNVTLPLVFIIIFLIVLVIILSFTLFIIEKRDDVNNQSVSCNFSNITVNDINKNLTVNMDNGKQYLVNNKENKT